MCALHESQHLVSCVVLRDTTYSTVSLVLAMTRHLVVCSELPWEPFLADVVLHGALFVVLFCGSLPRFYRNVWLLGLYRTTAHLPPQKKHTTRGWASIGSELVGQCNWYWLRRAQASELQSPAVCNTPRMCNSGLQLVTVSGKIGGGPFGGAQLATTRPWY